MNPLSNNGFSKISDTLSKFRKKKGSVLLAGSVFLGGGVTYFHWIGLVLGGLCIGLFSKTLRRAVLYGFVFGLAIWVGFAASMFLDGVFWRYVGMGQIFYVSVGISLLLPTVSASIRGLV